jgi:Putative zinc-finger
MIEDEYATWDAAYVLGSLDDDERRAYEQHLRGCATCMASVRSLGDLPVALAMVAPAELDGPEEPPPPTLLPSLLWQVRRSRRRRRLIMTSLGAVAAACIVLAGVFAWRSTGSSPSTTPSAGTVVALSPPAGAPVTVQASAHIQQVGWGTRVDLTCRHVATGGPYDDPNEAYRLVVIDRSNSSQVLGSWKLLTGKDTHFTGGTSLPATSISRVEITASDGQPLLVGVP